LLAISLTAGAALAGWLLAFFRIRLPWFVIRGVYYAACGFPVFVFAMLNKDVAILNSEVLAALVMPVLIMDWRWMTSSRRRSRVSVVPSLVAAVIAATASTLIESASAVSNETHVIAVAGLAAIAAMATQLLMPFSESRSQKVKMSTDWIASLEGLAECLAQEQDGDGEIGRTATHGSLEASQVADIIAITDGEPDSDKVWSDAVSIRRGLEDSNDSSIGGSLAETPTDAPPRARMPALVLSLVPLAMMPVFGLHRFYAGKVFSGVLYLLTLGLLGVGQLVDVILIALGEFRDAEGRLLTAWRSGSDELSTAGEKVNSLSVVPSPRTFFSDGLVVVGGLTLVATVLIGVALAIDVPKMIAVDMFRSFDLTGADLQAIFGTNTWPELLRELLQLLTGIMAVVTAGLLIASRRALGVMHLVRVPVAFLPFAATCGLLMEAFYRVSWERVANGIHEEKVGLILEEFLSHNDFIPSLIGAAVAFAVGLLILAWPPRREPVAVAEQVHTPIAQRH
jgi:hypothetical protein